MFKNTRGFLFAAFTALALSACGGGSVGEGNETPNPNPGPDPTGPSSTPTAVVLVTTSDVLRSDADTVGEGAPLTAIVTDANGNTVSGASVVFQLVAPNNAGALVVGSSTTGEDGTARATLTTGGNPAFPRTIAVRARVGTINSATRNFAVVSSATPVDPVEISDVAIFASSPVLRADADTAEEGVTLTAVVTNADGNVVPNVPVTFSRTLVSGSGNPGNLQIIRGTTDTSGTAVAILTTSGNTAPRRVNVVARATADGVNYDDDINIDVVAVASRVDGTISSARLPNNDSAPVTARARAVDANGNPAPNVPVTFFVSSGRIFAGTIPPAAGTPAATATSATVTTGANGETGVVTIDTAGNRAPRIITVTMTAPGAEADTADIAVVPAVALGGLQLRSASTAMKADADTPAEALPLTAVLTDEDGNLISGEPVTFRIASGVGSLQVVRGISDDSGTAVVNLTNGGNSSFSPPRTITVEARAQNRTATRTINVVDPASPVTPLPVAAVNLFGSSDVLFSDADTSGEGLNLTAVVTDTNGNVVPNVPVSFSVALLTGSGVPGSIQVTRGTTDATGTATAILTTAGNAGIRTVQVTANVTVNNTNFPDTFDVQVVGRAATLEILPSGTSLFNDDSAPVSVVVAARTAAGGNAANVPVSLSASSGSLSSAQVTTGSNGRTPAVTLTTGGDPISRTIRINAVAAGGISATSDIQVIPAVASVLLTSSASRIVDGSSDPTATLTALVRSSAGNVLSGIPVRFAVSGTDGRNGAVQVLGTGVTGDDGRVRATLSLGNSLPGDTLAVTAIFDRQTPQTPIPSNVATVQVVSRVTTLELLASSTQLSSAANSPANGVVLTALLKDPDQNVVQDAAVSFAIVAGDNGQLTPIRTTTDAAGTAQAVLTTSNDPTDRTIRVRATSGSATRTVSITVVGTRLSITGPNTAQQGVAAEYVATLVDDAGRGISDKLVELTSSSGTVTSVPAGARTNVNGQVTFQLVAGAAPVADLTATALNGTETATKQVSVTADSLRFVDDDPANAPVYNPSSTSLDTPVSMRVVWTRDGAPVVGKPITFSASRGTVLAPATVNTDALGAAIVQVQSGDAGPATIIARGVDLVPEPDRTPVAIQSIDFLATVPASVSIEAEPTVIGPNQQSTVTAVVRDARENLVGNATVNFNLSDSIRGTLSAGSAITDAQGRASVVYTASSTPSGSDGVRITATVADAPASVTDTVFITVGSRSARIVLGTGNTIVESEEFSRYILPYSAIVTDNAGNPAPDATLRLTLNPKSFYKGYYVENTLTGKWVQVITAECVAEDANSDGIMQPGEDINGNGQLDPSNPGAPSNTSPTLNASGIAEFNINYPQDRSNWVGVQLTARASVSGTEAIERANFVLPILADDLELANGAPPGSPSPFGTLSRCDRDDTLVPFVRVRASSAGVTVAEPTASASTTVNITFELVQPRTPATYSDTIVVTVGADFDGIPSASRATIDDDFSLPTNQVTFLPGQTTATLPVVINRDFLTEGAESFNVRLFDVVTNNAVITSGSAQRAVVTINPPP